ncbi:MAG: GH3 auxin-responsive promoter family protein [Fimbriiglobus sp.]
MSLTHEILIRIARAASMIHLRRQRQFLEDCDNPQAIQQELLFQILRRQALTGFGQDHGFGSIRTVEDYRRQVPVAPYERLQPYIARLMKGESSALIADDELLMFALTSGTTSARKHIPLTRRYLADYKRAWAMWGVRAYRDHRPRKMPFRPIVQMMGDPEEYRTDAGIPCGNASGFAASVQSRMARWMYTVPAGTGKLKDSAARYYLAMRLSIGRPCALFCAANPSTLMALGRTIETHADTLLRDLHDGTVTGPYPYTPELLASQRRRLRANPRRATELREIAKREGRLLPKHIWPPETILIGCWTGGSMTPYLRQLPEYWGDAPIRDLGLVASEGRFTLPFANDTPAGVLDIRSHYFEFIPESEIDNPQPTVLEAHELVENVNYFIIPTTSAGLYRYHISDLVRVRGYVGRTPMVEFVGKGNRFSNMTGEKISEYQVVQALSQASRVSNVDLGTCTLAPIWNEVEPHYALLTETNLSDPLGFLTALDHALQKENDEYQAKRDSKRLGPIRLHLLPAGSWERWIQNRLEKTGGSPEQYKHPILTNDQNFAATFSTGG